MPTNYLALYRGRSPEGAQLVAVSSEPDIVELFISALVGENEAKPEEHTETTDSCSVQVLDGEEG